MNIGLKEWWRDVDEVFAHHTSTCNANGYIPFWRRWSNSSFGSCVFKSILDKYRCFPYRRAPVRPKAAVPWIESAGTAAGGRWPLRV